MDALARLRSPHVRAPRIASLLVLLAAFAGALVAAPPSHAAASVVGWCGGTEESSADRLPELQASPNQIRVVYAIPADGPDNFAADAPLIATDIAAIDAWWQAQDPSRTPRFDLYPFAGCPAGFGQLDLGFVRLPQPGSAYLDVLARLQAVDADLAGVLNMTQQRKTLVYYDGPVAADDFGQNVCGTSTQGLGGQRGVSVVWLQACDADLGSAGQKARTTAHELLHNLGAVPTRGPPHECPPPNDGHVCPDPTDLMFPFVAAGETLAEAVLDVGRDDYYGHNGAWPDAQDSPWLERLPQQQLVVAVTGSAGTVRSAPNSISCPPSCTAVVDKGTAVTLTTVPGAGTRFVAWSGACVGIGTCTVTMDSAKDVTALFGATFKLAVRVNGRGTVVGGGLSCPARCAASLPGGVSVLRAKPATGYRFAGWSGDCHGNRTCTLGGDRQHRVTARFVRR